MFLLYRGFLCIYNLRLLHSKTVFLYLAEDGLEKNIKDDPNDPNIGHQVLYFIDEAVVLVEGHVHEQSCQVYSESAEKNDPN